MTARHDLLNMSLSQQIGQRYCEAGKMGMHIFKKNVWQNGKCKSKQVMTYSGISDEQKLAVSKYEWEDECALCVPSAFDGVVL